MKNVKEPNQSRYADIVIQLQRELKEGLENELKNLISDYDFAYILHDKDTYEDGTLKGKHIHLFLDYGMNANKRHSAVVNEMTALLKDYVIDRDAISVCLCGSKLIDKKLNYLTHSNKEDIEKGKYRYEKTDIVASPKYSDKIFAKELSDNALKVIVELLENGADTITIINEIGMEAYNKYRWTISDIAKCVSSRNIMSKKERQIEVCKQYLFNYLLNGGNKMTDRDILNLLAETLEFDKVRNLEQLQEETPF